MAPVKQLCRQVNTKLKILEHHAVFLVVKSEKRRKEREQAQWRQFIRAVHSGFQTIVARCNLPLEDWLPTVNSVKIMAHL